MDELLKRYFTFFDSQNMGKRAYQLWTGDMLTTFDTLKPFQILFFHFASNESATCLPCLNGH